LRLGSILLVENSYEKAEVHLLEALRREADSFMANYCLALVYLDMPSGEPKWMLPAKALLHAQKATELRPADQDAWQVAQIALAAIGKAKPPE